MLSKLSIAGSQTVNIKNKISINPTCIIEVPHISFPEVRMWKSITSPVKILTLCTDSQPYEISFNEGTYGNYQQRKMHGEISHGFLLYNVFINKEMTQVLGAGLDTNTKTIAGIGTGKWQNLNAYIHLPAQNVIPDEYKDEIVVTLWY